MEKKKWCGRILAVMMLFGFAVSGISDSTEGVAAKAQEEGVALEEMQDNIDAALSEETAQELCAWRLR